MTSTAQQSLVDEMSNKTLGTLLVGHMVAISFLFTFADIVQWLS